MSFPPLLGVWVVYMLIIGVLNSPLSISTAQRSVSYFLFPLLFWATIYGDEPIENDSRKLALLIFLIAVQIPVTMVQKVIFWGFSPDLVGGTLGRAGTNFLAILMGVAFCYMLTNWLFKKTMKSFVIMLTTFIPMALGNANAGFVFSFLGGLVVLGIFFFDPKHKVTRKISGLFALLIPILLSFILLAFLLPKLDPAFDKTSWTLFTSPDYFIQYTSGFTKSNSINIFGPANRLEQIVYVSAITKNQWFGSGVGILSYSDLLGTGPNDLVLHVSLLWATAITRHLLETGIIGTLLYIFLLFSFIPISVRVLKRNIYDGQNKIFLTSFPALVLIFILSAPYCDAWRFLGTACLFWLSAGIVWRQYQNLPKNGRFQ